MLIPVVLAALVVVVLLGIFLAGGFKNSGLDADEIYKLAQARGWQLDVSGQGTSRGVYTLRPPGGDWRLVLRRAERSRTGGQFGPIATMAGGSGTAWHSATPSVPGFVAVASGEPLPEGEANDLLAGPAASLVRPLLAQAMREMTGGEVAVPARLVAFRSGDEAFDRSHRMLTDDVVNARHSLNEGVRAALAATTKGPAPSLVLSSAGLQLALEGDVNLDALDRLVSAGIAARAALASR